MYLEYCQGLFDDRLNLTALLPAGPPLQELYPNTAAQEEEERAEALSQAARCFQNAPVAECSLSTCVKTACRAALSVGSVQGSLTMFELP